MHYPKRNGFLYSFKSVSLLQGATLFDGLQSVEAKFSVEGADPVFGTGTKGLGYVKGELHVELSLKFMAESFFDYARSYPQFCFEMYNVTLMNQEGSKRSKITLETLRFKEASMPSEGTDATMAELEATALDLRINGKSVAPGGAQQGAGGNG